MELWRCFAYMSRALLYSRAALPRTPDSTDLDEYAERSREVLDWLSGMYRELGYAADYDALDVNRGHVGVLPIGNGAYDVFGPEKERKTRWPRVNLWWVIADHAGQKHPTSVWSRFLKQSSDDLHTADSNFRHMIGNVFVPGTAESAMEPILDTWGGRGEQTFGIRGPDRFPGSDKVQIFVSVAKKAPTRPPKPPPPELPPEPKEPLVEPVSQPRRSSLEEVTQRDRNRQERRRRVQRRIIFSK